MKKELQSFPDASAMSRAVAGEWLALLGESQSKPFFLALSGGRSAAALFAELDRTRASLFANTHFFWADERCVAPTEAQSNYSQAEELFFRPLNLSADKIHRLRGELSPEMATSEANAEVGRIVPKNESGLPVFDLVLLGMGEDGHVASLFPNASADVVLCRDAYLHVANSPKPPPKRISLSYAALAAAKKVWVIALGKAKEEALRQSLEPNARTPLAQLLELRPETKIFADF